MASLTSTADVRLLPPEISPVDFAADLSVPSLWWWRFSPVVVLVGTVGLPLVFPLLATFTSGLLPMPLTIAPTSLQTCLSIFSLLSSAVLAGSPMTVLLVALPWSLLSV